MTDQPNLVGALPAAQPLHDFQHLALALGGDITSFTGQLLQLIAKSDPGNRERLRIAFPRIVRSWELWLMHAPHLTAGQMQQLVDEDTLTAVITANAEQLGHIRSLITAIRTLTDPGEGEHGPILARIDRSGDLWQDRGDGLWQGVGVELALDDEDLEHSYGPTRKAAVVILDAPPPVEAATPS